MNRSFSFVRTSAILAAVLLLLASACGSQTRDPFANELGWDLRALPSYGTVQREIKTPGDGLILVTQDGEGEPAGPSTPLTLHYQIYTADGVRRDRGVFEGLTTASKREGEGFRQGLAGIKRWERRRILVPAALARKSSKSRRYVPSDQDLVYDIQWAVLRIEDQTVGTGEILNEGDVFEADYRLTLDTGEEMANSFKDGQRIENSPLKAPGLIEGFVEGAKGMRVGGRRTFWVPWHIGYGAKVSRKIPAYSNLTFELALHAVKKPKAK